MQKLLLLLALFFPVLSFSQADTTPPEADGPYLMYDESGELIAKWAWPEGRKCEKTAWSALNTNELPFFNGFRPETVNPDTVFVRRRQAVFQGVEKLAVVSDIHGQYDVILKLLQSHGIIGEDHRWSFGKGHFVVVGDIFDRGDQVTETLWFIYNLQKEAAAAGGRVHFLLGNHETMVMEGDIRYIHKRYLITGALFQTPYQQLYGKSSYLGRWLRTLPLSIRINDMVFVHGGFSKELLDEVGGLQRINDVYHKHLIGTKSSLAVHDSAELALLHGPSGPLWYRGYFLDSEFKEKDIDRILKKLKAEQMVVGHTSFDAVKSFFNGKVIAVDSSIKFGSMGEILLIEGGEMTRGSLLGERLALEHNQER
ncbi:metallophosphoesterase [Neolewinella persica]|uniref:metallophosphoesterase n=1 Tax=Neolewinella persica TaxID=70998 RepID=UPI00039D8524|nr:metallophosphoesterase [Neolewinella persica]